MFPSIQPGDRIFANKLIYGARIYRNLDFLKGGDLKTIRMKGFRGIGYNDVVVFNRAYPLVFDIRQVYVKRCIGLPGDTIWIREGQYKNSSVKDRVVQQHFNHHYHNYIPESSLACYPFKEELDWTILHFGPLYLPRKGESIPLDQTNIWLYFRMMSYECGEDVEIIDDTVFWRNQPIQSYTFKENYYFFAGDNFISSSDSRYFGPIPETFIIGVVPYVLYARKPESKKMNVQRIFKRL
jgi:signal peptidase I